MKNWKSVILLIAVIVCISIYIGVFIGRTSTVNTTFMSTVVHTDAVQNTHPTITVNLNTASADELIAINGMDAQIARNIISYREESGDFVSVRELLRVNGITDELYEQIKPFVIVGGS